MLLDAEGRLVSVDSGHEAEGEELAELAGDLLSRASANQVEVSTGAGVVYVLRDERWTLVVVASRFALSSLVFFDMRHVLEALA